MLVVRKSGKSLMETEQMLNKVYSACDYCAYHYDLTEEEHVAIDEGRFEDIRGFGCESIDKYGYCVAARYEEEDW